MSDLNQREGQSAAWKPSRDEYERLIGLFPYPRKTRGSVLGAEPRANLMLANTPEVARRWLQEEGLLDEQQ